MTDLTLMTAAEDPATVLPSLALLPHRVRVLPLDLASIVRLPEDTILFVDARDDLATAKTVCLMMHASGLTMQKLDTPVLSDGQDGLLRCGDLVMDVNGYTASLHGHPLDLAYKEFELLKYLMQHPGHVFTRAQLLQEVWGYDYYGGTRTVDVHIRRLRAKLGGEYEHMIGTVRNVGYRFDPPEDAMGDE